LLTLVIRVTNLTSLFKKRIAGVVDIVLSSPYYFYNQSNMCYILLKQTREVK